ncbi:MAG TPA: cobaltochelatase subunit CobN [Acidimicrobiales bacterium]|nr:cobaltochelatase subunit CobN [Acidimicrobiales bacterium]
MILFLTNADTELLCLRTLAEGLPEGLGPLRAANPERLGGVPSVEGVDLVAVRLLGGRRSWEEPFDRLVAACADASVPLLAFGGEAWLDRELAEASSVPLPTLLGAFDYLVQGGPSNLEQFLRFVSDEVLGTAHGFGPAIVVPECGVFGSRDRQPGRPTVAVIFYRAHLVAGNTRFVDELCDGIEAAGANAVALYCYSLRSRSDEPHPVIGLLERAGVGAVVTTVLAAGAMAESLECWDPGTLATLDVPVVQAICATTDARSWADSQIGLSPVDVAMSVAIPEFDGRIVSVPFSFKEEVDDGDGLGTPVSAYRTVPDRVARVAGLAVALARLRSVPVAQRRVALVLSAYPTKRSRLGNAVGLDTPASVLELLGAMTAAGYAVDRYRSTGDELMAELADGLVYGPAAAPAAAAVGRFSVERYREWFALLPEPARRAVEEHWGAAPGTVSVDATRDDEAFIFSGLSFGNVVVAVQPPRGFGENPVAVYHSPDLPPTHHYLAFYRWLAEGFGAHAIVHVGKHGTLEWLPGKGVGLSAGCFPDAALGDLPLVYPFVVNDPGEGTQAKRRTHAVVVDHLVPPLTRADSYDDVARLEELLDTHARLLALDPSKLPTIRAQVWEALVQAEIHRDLGLAAPGGGSFEDPAFDDVLLGVDGYLCELKDAQIRGGLHVLGRPPTGPAELDMVAAITRLPQGAVGSLRAEVADALGLGEPDTLSRTELDALESECLRRLELCQRHRWDHPSAIADGAPDTPALGWVCGRLAPALAATTGELDAILAALDGRFVQPGPSGAPTRGMANVLPTGRNFYALDPRAVPSRLAWDVGRQLADRVLERHLAEEGRYPTSVGLVVWGTSAMRTGGDDIAEALALLGVRPRWAEGSGRVEGLELIGPAELGRPRVDVTLRVSGFFRDAFPHVLDLLDRAVRLAATATDHDHDNPVARIGPEEPRVFGPKPGAYGSGILALLESGQWRDDADLASVYVTWGGWAYGAGGAARPAEDVFAKRLAAIEVAVKNQDNREHDIFDSDDYLQDHGGMVAAVRALSGRQPKAWFGDSANPARPKVRSLAEEAARVVRTRVLNPKWLAAMERHGYKGAFEMAATVDYLFGYDATADVLEDWMYERVTETYVGDAARRKFFAESNPWALRAISERLLEAAERGLWNPSAEAVTTLRSAILEGEGMEEDR